MQLYLNLQIDTCDVTLSQLMCSTSVMHCRIDFTLGRFVCLHAYAHVCVYMSVSVCVCVCVVKGLIKRICPCSPTPISPTPVLPTLD